MLRRGSLFLLLSVLLTLTSAAKNKKKMILPADVLQAKSVLVVIDPDAGATVEDPLANRVARDNVEKALTNWGRFRLALNASDADLVISIRKGTGKMAQPTVGGIPNNDRPVIFQPSDSGGRAGGGSGSPSLPSDPTGARGQGPHPQVEVGEPEDTFAVYRGQRDNPLDSSPVWRYMGQDALRAPAVPAVDAFRKAVVEAEKQQANQP
jgi:hypothetical protein